MRTVLHSFLSKLTYPNWEYLEVALLEIPHFFTGVGGGVRPPPTKIFFRQNVKKLLNPFSVVSSLSEYRI